MTALNIVDFIETPSVVKFAAECSGKMFNKLKSKFSEEDKNMFISNFYGNLNYNAKTDFVIDLDKIWKWIGFCHKDNAMRLIKNTLKKDIDYINIPVIKDALQITHGGHNIIKIMLTINAFKLICLKAATKKARQIQEYYINVEEMLKETINEETNELKLQLDELKNEFVQAEETHKKEFNQKLLVEKAIEKQNILLREFGNAGALIYIIKVKSYENGEYIIKIGESRRGIAARYNEHKSKYEEALLLDCFMVKRSRDFEFFIHNHQDVYLNKVTDLQGHETEQELFLMGKHLSYGVLLNIIKSNINIFNEIDYESIRIDVDAIKTMLENQSHHNNPVFQESNIINKLFENQNLLLSKISALEKTNREILEKLNATQTRTTTNFDQLRPTIGPRLQKISPDTMQLVKVYETVTECMKENSKIKRPSINKAIQENTVYHGYRWAYVDRELDANVIHHIEETKKTRPQNLGYIAKVSADKTQIVNVYLDRKTAAQSNGYQSPAALDTPVKNCAISNGYYYMLYEKCEDALKANIIARNNGVDILLYKDGIGKYNMQHNLTKEFACKYDCIRTLNISDKTLRKALDINVAYNGAFYKSIGSKLQCFA